MSSVQIKYTNTQLLWTVISALLALTYSPLAASSEQNSATIQASTPLPPHLDCGKLKGATATSICKDITSKFQECVTYNERLGNEFDCGKDKQLLELRAIADSAEQAHLQSSKPGARIGMTKKQVVEKTSWGSPIKVNSTIISGRVSEQWVYGDGNYLYFERGRLKAIQTSE